MPVKKCEPVNVYGHSIQQAGPPFLCQLQCAKKYFYWRDKKKKYVGQLINTQSGCNSSTICNKIAFSFHPELFPSSLKLNHFSTSSGQLQSQSVQSSIKILSKYDFKLPCENFLTKEMFCILDWSGCRLCLYV